MGIWINNDNAILHEEESERKGRFIKIGEKVYAFFTERAIEAGFQEREGQLDMACEIVDGIKENKNVLVEAGVGIGKSFAYIVPALYYNKTYHRPIIIATSTIALQEQLIKDIQTIMKMIRYEVEIIVAKGQNHFLCKNRCMNYFTDDIVSANKENQQIFKLVSVKGKEKADWNIDIPSNIWNQINVKEYKWKYCKYKCAFNKDCYYHWLRQKMLNTNGVIVCNQDLLAIDMYKKSEGRRKLMNDEVGVIIVDEAHNLESKVRASLTVYITSSKIKSALYGTVRGIRRHNSKISKNIQIADRLIDDVFYKLMNQMLNQDNKAREKGENIDRYYVKNIGGKLNKLVETLNRIYDYIDMSFDDFGGIYRPNNDDAFDELEKIIRFLDSMKWGENSDDIFWMERDKKNYGIKSIKLYSCPKKFENSIFYNSQLPVILTSATITNSKNENYEKDYAYFIKSVGLSGNRSIICESKISPFDYDKHAMIYYSDNMPHPTKERDTFLERSLEEIKKLLEISNGKTLILFTAKTDMQIVYEKLLNEKLPFNILMQQGNSNQKETLKKFREDTNSVLLGTGSYWEGINIEGASLSQVIIFKLPFPIREPIIDYKYSKSRNGLMEVAVPEMIIKLKQGIGRLIRSEEDKGIISIIDSRIGDTSTAPYKEVVWKSLPIKNRTNDIRKIKNFYEDIFSN